MARSFATALPQLCTFSPARHAVVECKWRLEDGRGRQDGEARKILRSSHTEHFTQALELSERGARLSSHATRLDECEEGSCGQERPGSYYYLSDRHPLTHCASNEQTGSEQKDASGMSG